MNVKNTKIFPFAFSYKNNPGSRGPVGTRRRATGITVSDSVSQRKNSLSLHGYSLGPVVEADLPLSYSPRIALSLGFLNQQSGKSSSPAGATAHAAPSLIEIYPSNEAGFSFSGYGPRHLVPFQTHVHHCPSRRGKKACLLVFQMFA